MIPAAQDIFTVLDRPITKPHCFAMNGTRFARVVEEGELPVEEYRRQGIDTSDPAVAAEYGQRIVERLRLAGLHVLADDIAQDIDDLQAFGSDGWALFGDRWWAETSWLRLAVWGEPLHLRGVPGSRRARRSLAFDD